MTSRCTSALGTHQVDPGGRRGRVVRPGEQGAVGREDPDPAQAGDRTLRRGDRLGDRVEHLDRDGRAHLLDPDDRGVARDRDEAGTGTFQRHDVGDEHRLGALALAEEERGAVGDAAVLPHDQVDVVLVAVGVGELDDTVHEVHGRRRAEAADHPDRLVTAGGGRRIHRCHRATKCARNLRTWLTWYAML